MVPHAGPPRQAGGFPPRLGAAATACRGRSFASHSGAAGGGLTVDEMDRVLGMLDLGVAPTIAELQEAEALSRCAQPRSLEVAVARWRIAVVLEQLGRETATAAV